ncbi:hypothetical protein HIM_03229 [Hirsutella minnesotensis 3608]|nr:hypothetical protein HIM_03229 [Hirsutella minnesotensis 3608]
MPYSLYEATVVMARSALASLDRILSEAEKHPGSSALLTARLVDDMKPLTFQVHYATFQAQAMAAKLCGREHAEPAEDVDTYAKMHARIKEAIDMLDEADRETVNEVGETTTSVARHEDSITVPVKALVGSLNMPNIYFHVSMAYAILRKEGVPLGKRDWSRAFVSEYIS